MPAGYGWSFPAEDELRIGVGSFDPRFHVKDNTVKLAEDLGTRAGAATRATGSRTSCATATEGQIFFAGDSAGHCLPLTAEGIRTAFYFGIACGQRAARGGGRATHPRRGAAPLPRLQRRARVEVPLDAARPGMVPRLRPRALRFMVRIMKRKAFADWAFDHYLKIAAPERVTILPPRRASAQAEAAATAA